MLAALILAAACTDDDAAAPATTGKSTTTTTVAPPTTPASPPSDGVLTIGLLVPRSDDSQLGQSLATAAGRAHDDIRRAGGRVRLETFAEDNSTADVAATVAEMRESGVDAVVGPASSTVAINSLDTIVDSRMVACSPTASSLLLDDFPDDNRFFRSIPSDSLQAKAIVEQTTGTGGRRVSVAYLDDLYGRGLFNETHDDLTNEALDIGPEIAFSSTDEQLGDEVDELLANDPEVIVVLADADTGPEILAQIGRHISRKQDDERSEVGEDPWIVVNDAIRRPAKPALIADMPADVRANIIGTSPNATPPSGKGLTGPYSVNAYDCVTAIALASLQAESDDPSDIAAELAEVSSSGQKCFSYEECAKRLDLNIDYDGPSGVFELSDDTGDPIEAKFEVFGFDAQGVDETTSSETVS